MAKKRMISLDIVDNDIFLNMPLSAQALYYHLVMRADDDGFITPLKVMRTIGANQDDLSILILKRYVLSFDSGVVVIKAWPVMNKIQKDRYLKTTYQREFLSLTTNEWGVYTEINRMSETIDLIENSVKNDYQINQNFKTRKNRGVTKNTTHDMQDLQQYDSNIQGSLTNRQQNVNKVLPQVRLGKVITTTSKLKSLDGDNNFNKIIDYWNSTFDQNIKPLPKRKKVFVNRMKIFTADEIAEAIANAKQDKFFTGQSRSGWIGDFDYLIRSDEIIEKYKNLKPVVTKKYA